MGVRSREESCLSREINQTARSRNRTDAKIVVEPPRPNRATSNQTKNHDHPTKLKPEPTHTETKPEGDVRTAVETDDRHRNVETENRDRSKKKKGKGKPNMDEPFAKTATAEPRPYQATDYRLPTRSRAVPCRTAKRARPSRDQNPEQIASESKQRDRDSPSPATDRLSNTIPKPKRQHARRTCQTHARDESAKRPPHDNLEVTLA